MPYEPNEEVNWRLLASSDEYVTRNGTDIPSWFDMELSRDEWPMKVVLSVVVDTDEGPIISGIRSAREERHSYQDVIKFFRAHTDPQTFLRFVTAYAAATVATGRVLDANFDKLEASGRDLKETAGKLNEHFAERAWPATKVQRRRRVTRELLGEVAEVYRATHDKGNPPTQAVAEAFNVSHSTAGRWVVEARKAGILGPAIGSTAGEAPPSASE